MSAGIGGARAGSGGDGGKAGGRSVCMPDGTGCPDGCRAKEHDGHAYVLCVSSDEKDVVDADEAADRCAALGDLGLAWIESSDENTFLRNWIMDTAPDDGVVWMGASDQGTEGKWVWGLGSDAEQFFSGSANDGGGAYLDRFEDFGEGQPGSSRGADEDCGAFDARVSWNWSDRDCSEAMPGFMCEVHPPVP